ncbi:MAG: Gfo/Idh/MocA family oxidoreductase [Acidimicrobiia bacterium]|nr:Gfo/Idh/MocA family oxidoreductase [Acidimicrobiia bacterium]
MKLRWGIMGTGGIAESMATTLAANDSTVAVVGSARPGAAQAFADRLQIGRAVDSHAAVAQADEVDVVYVATTNDLHYQNTLDAIAAGKPVLCEKPIALNADQATEMLSAATEAGVFAMEALWMRFLPFIGRLNELISEGVVGTITHVAANFSFPATLDPQRRWMNRSLGGGALLDLGIYPISLIHHLLGPPERFEATARLSSTEVDVATQVVSHHAGGATAAAMCSFTADTTTEAVVAGSEGRIRIHAPFYHSRRLTVERKREVIAEHDTDFTGNGLRFEVAETETCIAGGRLQSSLRPHVDTLEVMEWLDAIRDRIGVRYPAPEE